MNRKQGKTDVIDIPYNRLVNQQIAGTPFTRVQEIVGWMGAMQAQDYGMAKWAVGVRLPGSSESLVESAISRGEIIRTHVLRPTWHFVSADDIYWMLTLTAPQIKASLKSRHQQLGLSEDVLAKSNRIIEKALGAGLHLTRDVLLAEFAKENIASDDNRPSHILMLAELDGIVCSGAILSGKHTYALLAERVPNPKHLTREEALASLAKRYFTSHGPATLQDFTWWSGLPAGEARRALEMVRPEFATETVGAHTYWFDGSTPASGKGANLVHLLPAYDEYIISYKDRRDALPAHALARVISSNGIFWPVIVVNGQVVGLWKRTIKRDKVSVMLDMFNPSSIASMDNIEKAALQYGHFLGKEAEITHSL
jgi:hypothetical protein